MDAPSFGRAGPTAGPLAATLAATLVAVLLAVSAVSAGAGSPGAAPPGAGAERLGTGDDGAAQAAFAVLPRRCYTDAGEVRPGPCHLQQFGADRPTVVVWGDSHAAQQIPPLRAQARRTRTNLIAFTMGLCPPMVVQRSDPDPCSRHAYRTLRFIEDKAARTRSPLTVVLGGFWRFYRTTRTGDGAERAAAFRRGDDRMFARLGRLGRQHGLRVAAIGQAPWLPPGSGCTLSSRSCPRRTVVPGEESLTGYLLRQLRGIPNAGLISIVGRVCGPRRCRLTVDGLPVFYDTVHLNTTLTARWASSFRWVFAE
jgi:hypothetical protein